MEVRQMLVRKLAAAYFTSWSTVLWLSFPHIALGGTDWNAAKHYMSGAFLIAVYAVPAIFIYGILLSSLLEAASVKFKMKGSGEMLGSGMLHAVFGLCFGFVLHSSLFGIIGGGAAILFFSFDRIIRSALPILKRNVRWFFVVAPVLLFILIAGAVYAASPPVPPFTAKEAVQFATSGTGTAIDRFPKEEGAIRLQIDGYDVVCETKVEELAEKETYHVVFTERWRKGEQIGQNEMIYEVRRGSMEARGGHGAEPPYLRLR